MYTRQNSIVIPFVKRLKFELTTIAVAPGIGTFQRAVEEKTRKYFDERENIETHRSYTFATLLDPRYNGKEKAQAARVLLISVLEEKLHQERSSRNARSSLNIK